MRLVRSLLLAAPLALFALTPARDASACGGCFHENGNTEVAAHRMIFSISPAQTTLWDQIEYTGDASSFAWVLPTKGVVTVGLSSDALFGNLSNQTQVNIYGPPLGCPPSSCGSSGFSSTAVGSGGGDPGGVVVTAQQVVGPYETVQLSSADPTALTTWLKGHQYNVPADIDPVIAAYVNEGFDFLAMKLVPGQGITSMKPVRVTSPGAGLSLPLRMVAAGVGPTAPITLWVLAEGAYVPQNFPSFAIDGSELVWDWASESSNYKQLRADGFQATAGKGWLIEASEPTSMSNLSFALTDLAMFNPMASGYADDMGMGAPEACMADLDTLFAGIDPAKLWISRLYAELPHAALSTDLTLAASANQQPVTRTFNVTATKGTKPMCPPDPCATTANSSGSGSGAGGAGGATSVGSAGAGGSPGTGGSADIPQPRAGSCAIGGGAPEAFVGLFFAAGLGASLRRRGRRQA
jgi:uncharacterized membrane protein YgcG